VAPGPERRRGLRVPTVQHAHAEPCTHPRQMSCGTAPLLPAAPVRPLGAELSLAPTWKSCDKFSVQPVAASNNRRLTGTIDP
jgi:hypothetical protein